MDDNKFPELVYQKSHHPGLGEAHTFEDALRDLVRNSPYLGISLLLHAIVLVVMMSMKEELVMPDETKKIVASMEEIEEPLPPEPPPEEPEIEEIEEIIEEPVITEDVVEVTEIVDIQNIDAAFDSTGANDVIGVGGGAGGNFGGRRGKLGKRGKAAGTPFIRAVDDALTWLKFHQNPDGYWSCDSFDDECGRLGDDGFCDGRGSPVHDIGVSGLAMLAFLGAGNTDKEGKYADTVKAGLKYLLDVQARDGNFADPNSNLHTYDHIIATLAVVEAYALTKHHRYKKSATKALDYMYSLRLPGNLGWRYADPSNPEMVAHSEDTSVTGWAILAMTLAKEYDLDVDKNYLEDSYAFIDEMTDAEGRTGYFERGGYPARPDEQAQLRWPDHESESMTAVGIICRIFLDPELDRPGNEDAINKGVALINKKPIEWSEEDDRRKDYYYWYYATYALYQVGGSAWKQWERDIEQIADAQIKEGEMKGSWDPQVDPWGTVGGRVYSTAILALTMEVYYRYDTVIGSH